MGEILLLAMRWVLSPFLWLRRMWRMLRELRTEEQRILSTRDLLVRELQQNAHLVEQYEDEKWSLGNIQMMFKTERWQQYAAGWSALRRSNKALWDEIADAYEAIELVRSAGSAAPVPSSEHLRDLADRLRGTTI